MSRSRSKVSLRRETSWADDSPAGGKTGKGVVAGDASAAVSAQQTTNLMNCKLFCGRK